MNKAIVTGGAGFIGSNLTSFLLEKGWKVRVIDDFSVGKMENLPQGKKKLEVIKADIRDQKKMEDCFSGFDIVFHLAVQCVRKSIHDPWLVHSVNSSGTLSVLEASRAGKIGKFIYVSSSEVYGTAESTPMDESHPLRPTTMYGASKLSGEQYSLAYFRTYGLKTLVVRPFNTYGYNEHFEGPYGEVIPRFVVRALNGLPLDIFGDGGQTRDFTFVTDTVLGIYLAAGKGKPGEIFNIARGEEISINKLAKLVLKSLSVKVPIKHLNPRPGDVRRHFADPQKAKKDLGFKAKVGIEEGLGKYIEWFKKTMPSPKDALKFYETENW